MVDGPAHQPEFLDLAGLATEEEEEEEEVDLELKSNPGEGEKEEKEEQEGNSTTIIPIKRRRRENQISDVMFDNGSDGSSDDSFNDSGTAPPCGRLSRLPFDVWGSVAGFVGGAAVVCGGGGGTKCLVR